MARQRNKLAAVNVRRMPPGNHPDGGGLYLRVSGTGNRTYSFRYRRGGRDVWASLGPTADLSLADARREAERLRLGLRDGRDVAAELRDKRRPPAPPQGAQTFKEAADALIAAKSAGWKNAKHAAQWSATLNQHAAALLPLPVDAIDTEAVLTALRPIWTELPETAARLRGRIEAVLSYATTHGWRSGENPARWRGHLAHILPARADVAAVEHHAALPWRDMPATYAKLSAAEGMAALCVRFIALTAARSGEARGATWGEIDLAVRTWTVPAVRMKAKREHRVPLSDEAVAILTSLLPLKVDQDSLVFPGGRPGKPLSDVAVSKALHRAASTATVTVHGLRSAFMDWAAETAPDHIPAAEAALAHTVRDKVRAAYNRTDYYELRITLMAQWASFCAGAA